MTRKQAPPDAASYRDPNALYPVLIYEDRITACLTEPKIFDDWRAEVNSANDPYHPIACLMEHDEMRVMDQCASCRAMHRTPGQLLAWNIHQSAAIIRAIRPDAGIWVWSDMFGPYHNATDHFCLVNGSLQGPWKGLDKDVGIVNWGGGGAEDSKFFAERGLPGGVGAVYTAWNDNYVPMDVWAQKAWAVR